MTQKSKSQNPKQQQNVTIIAAIVALAVIGAAAVIFISSRGQASASDFDYSTLHQERTEDGAYVLGDPDAPITIVEFADFLCPHCQEYKPTIDQVIEELVASGQARFEFRMFASVSQPPYVVFNFAECAADMDEGGFWVVHDELFYLASRGANAGNIGRQLADRLDIDYTRLLECTQDVDQIETDMRIGSAAGVSGTPGVRVRYNNGRLQALPGYDRGGPGFDALRAAVVEANLAG